MLSSISRQNMLEHDLVYTEIISMLDNICRVKVFESAIENSTRFYFIRAEINKEISIAQKKQLEKDWIIRVLEQKGSNLDLEIQRHPPPSRWETILE